MAQGTQVIALLARVLRDVLLPLLVAAVHTSVGLADSGPHYVLTGILM